MTRCKHCNKLTHDEHMKVYVKIDDHEKIIELRNLKDWQSKYEYIDEYNDGEISIEEYGRLKCGDIYLHFCFI